MYFCREMLQSSQFDNATHDASFAAFFSDGVSQDLDFATELVVENLLLQLAASRLLGRMSFFYICVCVSFLY